VLTPENGFDLTTHNDLIYLLVREAGLPGGRCRAGAGRSCGARRRPPAAGRREERPPPRCSMRKEGVREETGGGRGKAWRFQKSEAGAAFQNAMVRAIFPRWHCK